MDRSSRLVLGVVFLLLVQSVAAVATIASAQSQPTSPVLNSPPVERWNATYGGQGTERAFDVVRTADGYVLGGSATSFGSQSDRRSDMWVVHVDADGQRTWARSFGTAGSETVRDLAATDDGGVLVVGELGASSGSRLYKLDAEGAVEWSRLFGSDQLARGAVAVGADEYVIVGNVVGEGFPRPGAVAFVRPDGEVRIDRLTGRSVATETFTAVTEASDGSLLLAGESDRGEGDVDAWVVKLTPNGTVVWSRLVPDPSAEIRAAAVTELQSGDVLVVGTARRGTVDDGWIARLDGRNGGVVWRTTYDRLSFADATPNGRGALVVGSSFESRVSRDAVLLSVDAQGRELWRETYGGAEDDVFNALAATDTGYLLVGWTDTGTDDGREEFFAVAVERPVTVESVTVDRSRVEPGETVTVTARLANRGDDPRRYEATLFIDGDPRETRARNVAVGNETTVTFSLSFETAGRYAVGVDEATPVTVDVTGETSETPETPETAGTSTTTEPPEPTPEPTSSPTPVSTTETASPGFGVVVAVAAVVSLSLLVAVLTLGGRSRRES